MKLYFYQPDGHGPYSAYVCAPDIETAVRAINAARDFKFEGVKYPDKYSFGNHPFTADNLEEREPGSVVWNANE